jgi:hypothetical protein
VEFVPFMLLDLVIHVISINRRRVWILVAGIAVALHCATANVTGASVTLAWDPSAEPGVSGYKVHYGLHSRAYPFVVDAGNATRQTIGDLQEGASYYFAVTAYNVAGQESDFSGEIGYAVPLRSINALGDGSFRIRFQGVPERTYRVEYTESLTAPNWRTLGMPTAGANGSFEIIDRPIAGSPARFYRWVYPAR